jgi:hypothetical protein
MSFAAIESSIESGEPILLFDFSLGLLHFRYTTADRPIVWPAGSGITFASTPVDRGPVKQGSEIKQQTLKVTGPRDLSVGQLYAVTPPTTPVALTIIKVHYTDSAFQGLVDWLGRVVSCRWIGSKVELSCEPVYTAVQTMGLRRRWQIGCPHVVYGPQCTVVPAAFAVPGTLTAVSGFTITAAAWATPPTGLLFTGGFVTWDTGNGYLERRTINSVASGGALTLDNTFEGLVVGQLVNAYPGCNRTPTNCASFRNFADGVSAANGLLYGGQFYIPTRNPMNGTPVY